MCCCLLALLIIVYLVRTTATSPKHNSNSIDRPWSGASEPSQKHVTNTSTVEPELDLRPNLPQIRCLLKSNNDVHSLTLLKVLLIKS